jgi:hypothetical protein
VATALVAALATPAIAGATTYPVSTSAQLVSAVAASNANPGADTIALAPGVYTVSNDLEVSDDLSVVGDASSPSIVDGGGTTFAIFDVGRNITVSFRTLTLRNAENGIDTLGALTTVDRTTVTGMTTVGIELGGDQAQITNSTISDNPGTGVDADQSGPATLTNVTVAGNHGPDGGVHFFTPVIARNTIIAGNLRDCGAPLATAGGSADHSLDSDGTCGVGASGGKSATNPRLGALADNGGPTQTRELLAGSPAINAGTATGCPPADQRGVSRVGACDMGAYEFDPSRNKGAAGTVGPGGTVTTDAEGDGATPTDPLETAVTTPTGGSISIEERSVGSFDLLGRHVQISAPAATPANPLRIVFVIDASLVPAGQTQNTIQVLKNGTVVSECPGSAVASPDPCVSDRALLAGGDVRLTIVTSSASDWTFATGGGPPPPPPPPPAGKLRVHGEGSVATAHKNHFDLHAEIHDAKVKGDVHYEDKTGRLHLKAKSIDSLTCTAGQATIQGTGVVGRSRVAFTVKVEDHGKSGDTFSIAWPSYSASGPLAKGKIEIKGC